MPRLGRKKIKALLEEHLNNSSCQYGIGGENPMLFGYRRSCFHHLPKTYWGCVLRE